MLISALPRLALSLLSYRYRSHGEHNWLGLLRIIEPSKHFIWLRQRSLDCSLDSMRLFLEGSDAFDFDRREREGKASLIRLAFFPMSKIQAASLEGQTGNRSRSEVGKSTIFCDKPVFPRGCEKNGVAAPDQAGVAVPQEGSTHKTNFVRRLVFSRLRLFSPSLPCCALCLLFIPPTHP